MAEYIERAAAVKVVLRERKPIQDNECGGADDAESVD